MGFGSGAADFAIKKAKGQLTIVSKHQAGMKQAKLVLQQQAQQMLEQYGQDGGFIGRKVSQRTTIGLRQGVNSVATLVDMQRSNEYFTNFSVIEMHIDDQEIINIQPAQDNTFFVESSGRASRTLRVNGALLNTERAEWFRGWLRKYDKMFRASRMVRKRAVHQLTVDGVNYYGLIFNFTSSSTASQENAPMFGFSFLIMDMRTSIAQGQMATIDERVYVATDMDQRLLVDKAGDFTTIGYRREEAKPSDRRLRALGKVAEYAMDPAKWAALQNADASYANQLAGGAVGTYVGAAGGVTGHGATNSLIETATTNGFTSSAALAIAKHENVSASTKAKLAETGMQAAEKFTKGMMGGIAFGVGEQYALGQDYDNAQFKSVWRNLLTQAVDHGFAAARVGIARGLKGGMSSINLANVARTKNVSTLDIDTGAAPTDSRELIKPSDPATFEVSAASKKSSESKLKLQKTLGADHDVSGPLFDFEPSQDHESYTDPVSLTIINNPAGTVPGAGVEVPENQGGPAPGTMGPIFDI